MRRATEHKSRGVLVVVSFQGMRCGTERVFAWEVGDGLLGQVGLDT